MRSALICVVIAAGARARPQEVLQEGERRVAVGALGSLLETPEPTEEKANASNKTTPKFEAWMISDKDYLRKQNLTTPEEVADHYDLQSENVPDMRSTITSLAEAVEEDARSYDVMLADAYSEARKMKRDKEITVQTNTRRVVQSSDAMQMALTGIEGKLDRMSADAKGGEGMGGVVADVGRFTEAVGTVGTARESQMLTAQGQETVGQAMMEAVDVAQDAVDAGYAAEAAGGQDRQFQRLMHDLQLEEKQATDKLLDHQQDGKDELIKLAEGMKNDDMKRYASDKKNIADVKGDEKETYKESKALSEKVLPKIERDTSKKHETWERRGTTALEKENNALYKETKDTEDGLEDQVKDLNKEFKDELGTVEEDYERQDKDMYQEFEQSHDAVKRTQMEESAQMDRNQKMLGANLKSTEERNHVLEQEAQANLIQQLKAVKALHQQERAAEADIEQMSGTDVGSHVPGTSFHFGYDQVVDGAIAQVHEKEDQLLEEHKGAVEKMQQKYEEIQDAILKLADELTAEEAAMQQEIEGGTDHSQATEEMKTNGLNDIDEAHRMVDEADTLLDQKLRAFAEQTKAATEQIEKEVDQLRALGFAGVDSIEQKVRPYITGLIDIKHQFDTDLRREVPRMVTEQKRVSDLMGQALDQVKTAFKILGDAKGHLQQVDAAAQEGAQEAESKAFKIIDQMNKGVEIAQTNAKQLSNVAQAQIMAAVGEQQALTQDDLRKTTSEVTRILDEAKTQANTGMRDANSAGKRMESIGESARNAVPDTSGVFDKATLDAKHVSDLIANLDPGTAELDQKAKDMQALIESAIRSQVNEVMEKVQKVYDMDTSNLDESKIAALTAAEEAIKSLTGTLESSSQKTLAELQAAMSEGNKLGSEIGDFGRSTDTAYRSLDDELKFMSGDAESTANLQADSQRAIADVVGHFSAPLENYMHESAGQVTAGVAQDASNIVSNVDAKVTAAADANAQMLSEEQKTLADSEVKLNQAVSATEQATVASENILSTTAHNAESMGMDAEAALEGMERQLDSKNPTEMVDSVEKKAQSNAMRTEGTFDAIKSREEQVAQESSGMKVPLQGAQRQSEITGLEGSVASVAAGEKLFVQQAETTLENTVGPFEDEMKETERMWRQGLIDENQRDHMFRQHAIQLVKEMEGLGPAFMKKVYSQKTENAVKMTQVYTLLKALTGEGIKVLENTEKRNKEHSARTQDWAAKSEAVMQSDEYKQLDELYNIDQKAKAYNKHLDEVMKWADEQSAKTFEWRKAVAAAVEKLGGEFTGQMEGVVFQRHTMEDQVIKDANNLADRDRQAIHEEQMREEDDIARDAKKTGEEIDDLKGTNARRSQQADSQANGMDATGDKELNSAKNQGENLRNEAEALKNEVRDVAQNGKDINDKIGKFLDDKEAEVSGGHSANMGRTQELQEEMMNMNADHSSDGPSIPADIPAEYLPNGVTQQALDEAKAGESRDSGRTHSTPEETHHRQEEAVQQVTSAVKHVQEERARQREEEAQQQAEDAKAAQERAEEREQERHEEAKRNEERLQHEQERAEEEVRRAKADADKKVEEETRNAEKDRDAQSATDELHPDGSVGSDGKASSGPVDEERAASNQAMWEREKDALYRGVEQTLDEHEARREEEEASKPQGGKDELHRGEDIDTDGESGAEAARGRAGETARGNNGEEEESEESNSDEEDEDSEGSSSSHGSGHRWEDIPDTGRMGKAKKKIGDLKRHNEEAFGKEGSLFQRLHHAVFGGAPESSEQLRQAERAEEQKHKNLLEQHESLRERMMNLLR